MPEVNECEFAQDKEKLRCDEQIFVQIQKLFRESNRLAVEEAKMEENVGITPPESPTIENTPADS